MSDGVRFLHGISHPAGMAGDQRSRILEATTDLLYEVGYTETTVSMIVGRARVSRRTFYEHFQNKEHCYAAVLGATVECIATAVRDAYVGADGWAAQVAAAFSEMRRLVLEHPASAHICLVEVAAGQEGASRRDSGIGLCRDGLCSIVESGPAGGEADPVAVELAVGGLLGLLGERLRRREPRDAADVIPTATGHLLEPLVGRDAARDVTGRLATGTTRVAARSRSSARAAN